MNPIRRWTTQRRKRKIEALERTMAYKNATLMAASNFVKDMTSLPGVHKAVIPPQILEQITELPGEIAAIKLHIYQLREPTL